MERNGLSIRRRTTVAQKLPEQLEELQHNFLLFILYHRIQFDYLLNLISNIDETPLTFDIVPNITIADKGARTITINSTGHEKSNFTCVLGILADGTKLPILNTFKLKKEPCGTWPQGVYVRVNEKVPGGCTSRLQPLDVAVNKLFKVNLRSLWVQWMNNNNDKVHTKSGNLKRPSYELVCQWTKTAWEMVNPDLIRHSFKVTGISMKKDGSEDDIIFDYESLQQPCIQQESEDIGDNKEDIEAEISGDEEEEDTYLQFNTYNDQK
ncbi:pogo transposable element with KRAB domain-like protein, partial [Endogone sp. FLAS-F59071]